MIKKSATEGHWRRRSPEIRTRPALVMVALLISASCSTATAIAGGAGYQLVRSLVFKPGAEAAAWYVKAYQPDVPDLTATDLPAKLCFSQKPDDASPPCFTPEAQVGTVKYAFQSVEALSVEQVFQVNGSESAILFVARFSGGGSGSLRLLSLWKQVGTNQTLTNILPRVLLTEQGEYKILPVTKNGHHGVFVTADYRLDRDESHFSPHHFDISIYQLSAGRDAFAKIGSYETTKKYPSLDDVDEIQVITFEMVEIERWLNRPRR
jgi:hypothetical protein